MTNLIRGTVRNAFSAGLIFVALAGIGRAEILSQADAGQVGMVVSKLLEERHYNPHPVNSAMSKEFLKNYINALDYNHLFFLQADVDGFQKYTNALDDDLILGNLKPAFEIYAVYSNRVEQASTLIKELATEKYTFDGNDSMVLDRHEAPWAANEKEWHELLQRHVKYELLEERLNKETPENASKAIIRRYDRMLRALHENDIDTITSIYVNSLTSLYDPHTQYLEPVSLDNFQIDMRLSLTGIGAVLQSEDGYAKINSVVPGGPAYRDKRLKMNDRIVAVAQGDKPMVDVVDMKLNKVVELIRGPKGTVVRLKIIPADAPDSSTRVIIELTRDEIPMREQEAKAKIIEKPTPTGILRIGYIDLPSFYVDPSRGADAKSCTRDVRRLVEKLVSEKIDGLVFDLRRDTGGSLPEVISMTGLFIGEGPVVQVKDSRGKVSIGPAPAGDALYDGPMVVLTSHISASASEIFAAALQDYGRALIIGEHSTFGKGTVQQMFDLDQLMPFKHKDATGSGALKLTIQKFYRVSGGSTQFKGVIPDIQLPSLLDVAKIGESYLPHCLAYDEVMPASFAPWSRHKIPVEELNQRSSARVAKNEEFQFIIDDIQRVKKRNEEKTVSLNENQRLAERKENEDRAEVRKKEREAHKVEPLKTTEITLKDLDPKTNVTAAAPVTAPAPAVVSTNQAAVADPKTVGTNKIVVAAAPEPGPEPHFDEGLNILTDYINLLGGMHAKN